MIYKLRLSSWGLLLLALLNTSHELSWRVSQEVRALSEPPAVDSARSRLRSYPLRMHKEPERRNRKVETRGLTGWLRQ